MTLTVKDNAELFLFYLARLTVDQINMGDIFASQFLIFDLCKAYLILTPVYIGIEWIKKIRSFISHNSGEGLVIVPMCWFGEIRCRTVVLWQKHRGKSPVKLKNTRCLPWLVWLSGLSASLQTKGSPVWFLVRAHAWVVGQVPSRGYMRGNHTLMFLSLSSSLPL